MLALIQGYPTEKRNFNIYMAEEQKIISRRFKDIFDTNVRYEIPFFQRGYAWEKKQWDKLFDDIYEEILPALENNNFEEKDTIREGMEQVQMIAVVDRSGRGKSTIFKVLTGLRQPTTARVLIHAENVEKPVEVKDEDFFFRLVRQGFVQRRKTLRNNLIVGLGKEEATKEKIGLAIESSGLDPKVRGEALSISDFSRLAEELKALDVAITDFEPKKS